MLSISKPQTNLIYLSILVGRLDLTLFKYLLMPDSYPLNDGTFWVSIFTRYFSSPKKL